MKSVVGLDGPPMRVRVERHTFESRVRVSPQLNDDRPCFAHVMIDEPDAYFASVQLEYFKVSLGTDRQDHA